MKRVINLAYLAFFLLLLAIPVLLLNKEHNAVSELDNRVLTEFPKYGDPAFNVKTENYLKDRIGLRDWMVTSYQLINERATGELKHPIYTYGQDGYVFFRMHNNIEIGVYQHIFAEAVLKMQRYCEQRGIKFYFMFDPEKIAVYRRYLPAGVHYNDNWVDELLTTLRENGVTCIDNREILTELSYKEQVFNRQYDAGHWNDLGCFYGTNNLWKTLQKDFPAVCEYSEEEFEITKNSAKYLASSRFPVNEEYPVFSLRTKWTDLTEQYDGIKQNRSFPYFKYLVNNDSNAAEYPKMLVFQGSYFNRSPQFFAGRAKEYIGIHDYQNVLNLDYYCNVFQPDLVIFEVAEYTVSDTYFDSEAMAKLDYNPGVVARGQSAEKTIAMMKEKAEEFVVESGRKLYRISGKRFDSIYFEGSSPLAKYVYLFTDNEVFDLQKDVFGIFSTGVPHNAVSETAILFYEDFAGAKHWAKVSVQNAAQYVESGGKNTCFAGAVYDAKTHQLFLETKIIGNRFNMVNVQLLDYNTGEFITTVSSTAELGTHEKAYIHTLPTDWYIIRIKANSNIQDEGLDIVAYLTQGRQYYYSFDVPELSEKKVVIANYEFFGPAADPAVSSF